MSRNLKVLIIDDSKEDALTIMEVLKRAGYELCAECVSDSESLKTALERENWDVVLSDHLIPGFSSKEVLTTLQQRHLDLPFIIVSSAGGEDVVVAEMMSGAHDYIIKGQYARLAPVIERELRYAGNRKEMRKVEARLREQAELLDKAQDAIIVTDLNEKIDYWNKSAELLYGWAATETLGQSMSELLSPVCSDKHAQAFQHALSMGEWKGELDHKTKNKTFLLVQSRLTLVKDHAGQPQRMLVVNTDLTEQKRWEARFLRSQRMESLGTLASGIAHDLNNVLAPILMAVHFLQDSIQDESSRTMLSTLEKSALRGADIIKQVLTFARGIEGERCILSVNFLIKDMAKIIEETFPKSIVARVNCPSTLWAVRADATQLNQVLMNLCINARDAMGDGGQLSILAENVLLDEYYSRMSPEAKPGPYVVITVSDTGPGIPAGLMDKIFDPFFTTKEVGKGTGLGLATALGIVKSHDGFIHVFSETGKGAHFKVFLPAQVGAQPLALDNEKERPLRGTDELIMIVEDEDAIRQITKKTLETNGYRVVAACDGTEALALYVQKPNEIKLIFTDMLMPYMDGLATIRALRKINPALKIIATSGMLTHKGELEAAGVDVLEFLPKPFTADQLLRVLRDALPSKDRDACDISL